MEHITYKPNLEELLLTFRRQIIEACRKDGIAYDLTFSQMELLRYLKDSGKETIKGVAQHLKVTPPSASALVSDMEKKELVVRTHDPTDRRTVYVALSPKAKKIFATVAKRKQTILSQMIDTLSEVDQKHLERIITLLIQK